ncbi:hypothetical protein GPECTOR_105g103 [Gonium pectorale]|uniref:RING-type domain-containing protein n=1 Tax=Gonium pectorale TaxID=33097 RepID=A0A150FZN6_GONPE|nr:hypothetical protein GPECTOR_105g103 [Gonium pectorale]|eukprot:KXZ43049.1 hypothetical protein GPECTOR_105g103 [Gonium pectorale]
MGCTASSLAVAELNSTIKHGGGDSRQLLGRLEDHPWLISSAPSVLISTAGTPLHTACERKHVEELLRHGPTLHAATTSDSYELYISCDPASTPLHFAAVRGNLPLAKLLLHHHITHMPPWGLPRGQDPRMRCNAGHQQPWQVAAAHHPAARELVALLHPGQPLEAALGLNPGSDGGGVGRVGPPPLASLAAVALRDKLLADLRRASEAAAAAVAAAQRAAAAATAAAAAHNSAHLHGRSMSRSASAVHRARTLSHERTLSCAASQQLQPQEADDEEGLCGLCFAGREEVAPGTAAAGGCGHAVCSACAEALARGLVGSTRPHPLACPFCRREVRGFVALPPRPEAGRTASAKAG